MSETKKLDDVTERLLADFRYCALSDTCVDDLSPYTENARDSLRKRIRELESGASQKGDRP